MRLDAAAMELQLLPGTAVRQKCFNDTRSCSVLRRISKPCHQTTTVLLGLMNTLLRIYTSLYSGTQQSLGFFLVIWAEGNRQLCSTEMMTRQIRKNTDNAPRVRIRVGMIPTSLACNILLQETTVRPLHRLPPYTKPSLLRPNWPWRAQKGRHPTIHDTRNEILAFWLACDRIPHTTTSGDALSPTHALLAAFTHLPAAKMTALKNLIPRGLRFFAQAWVQR